MSVRIQPRKRGPANGHRTPARASSRYRRQGQRRVLIVILHLLPIFPRRDRKDILTVPAQLPLFTHGTCAAELDAIGIVHPFRHVAAPTVTDPGSHISLL